MDSEKITDLLIRNPFYILELPVDPTPREIERQGNKLLGMLELDVKGSTEYPTPWGTQTRDAADIRQAMAELRDPVRYHFHAFWLVDSADNTIAPKQEQKILKIDFLSAAGFRSLG